MKRAFWFVLVATVLLTLAGAAWLIGVLRPPIRVRRVPSPQPQTA
jgi:hypothetical protein